MTDNSMLPPPPPGGPAPPAAAVAQPRPGAGRAALAAVIIIAASLVTGLAGGVIWAVGAPRVLYQMYSLNPPTAYAVNPETSGFIAADAWYCFIALAGGVLIGLIGYFYGVRRFGSLPMAAVVVGAVAAAFLSEQLGPQFTGKPGFNHTLATTRPGAYLRAPISLGSHGALAFWPLAAAAVAGGLELFGVMRARQRDAGGPPRMPGLESFGYSSGRPEETGSYRMPGAPAGDDRPSSPAPYGYGPADRPPFPGAPGPESGHSDTGW